MHGETIDELAARRDLLLHAQGAGRRGRRHHPVERPAHGDDLEDRPGAGDGLHRRAEARRGGAADAAAAGRAVPGGRRSAGRRQRRARLRRDRRCGACRPSRRRQGGLHRLAPDRAEDRPGLGRQPEARVAGARRQVARHRLRRRRSRRRGAGRRHGGVRQLRPDLQRRHAPVRRAAGLRGVRRAGSPRFGEALRVGDGADPETQVGPLVSRRAARSRHRLSRHRPPGRARAVSAAASGSPTATTRKATSCRRRCSPT